MNNASSFPSLPAMAAADPVPAMVPEGVLVDQGAASSTNPSLADVVPASPVGPSFSEVVQRVAPVPPVLTPVGVGNVPEPFPQLGSAESDIRAFFPRSPKGQRKFQSVKAGENPIPTVGSPTGHLLDSPVRCPSRPLTPKPARATFELESHSLVTLQAAKEFDPLKNLVGTHTETVTCVVDIAGAHVGVDDFLEASSSSDESVQTVHSMVQAKPTNLGGENRS
jgi:hypothetical protein